MNLPLQAVRSLGRVKVGRETFYILPPRGLIYGAISLAIVLGLLFFIDRVVLGSLERGGWTSGEQWKRHNQIVEENHRRQTTTNECELRHWNGEPLPSGKQHTILVLGDSFVWGPPYVTLNHLWWRQLAIELQRRGYHDVRVVAAGHPGWSTRRQLECARHLVPEVKPDLVVWGYVTNDPDEKLVRQIFDSQDRPPYGQRIRRQLKRLLPNVMFKFESLRADKLAEQYAGPEYGYAYSDWELKLLEGENFERYRETVGEVGEFLKQAGVPAFLQTLPQFPGREYFEPRYEPVLSLWQAAGVPVVNTLNEFVRRYGDAPSSGPESIKWGINPADSHPGPTATRFFATQAADLMEQKWPEALGPKDEQRPHELAINDWLPNDLDIREVSTGEYEGNYLASTAEMQSPMGTVALRYPMPLTKVGINHDRRRPGMVWVLFQAENEFEPETWHEMIEMGNGIFMMPAPFATRRVSALRFTADEPGRRLRLLLLPPSTTRAD